MGAESGWKGVAKVSHRGTSDSLVQAWSRWSFECHSIYPPNVLLCSGVGERSSWPQLKWLPNGESQHILLRSVQGGLRFPQSLILASASLRRDSGLSVCSEKFQLASVLTDAGKGSASPEDTTPIAKLKQDEIELTRKALPVFWFLEDNH